VSKEALVVDDAATVRMYHGGILRDAGFDVAQAANGYEALETAIERRFDLMVVDVNMPQMDGYALVAAVRRAGLNRATPIIMVSTESASVDADQAYAAGANVYLRKPATPEDLASLASTLTGAAGR
jgi:two-component system, chemotaxis family, chemotaxis protein CheY